MFEFKCIFDTIFRRHNYPQGMVPFYSKCKYRKDTEPLIILSCTHLYHFHPVSIHSLQDTHFIVTIILSNKFNGCRKERRLQCGRKGLKLCQYVQDIVSAKVL